MKQICSYTVVEEMVCHTCIQAVCHLVQKSPFDAHHSGEDDISDAETYKCTDSDIAINQVVKRCYYMPYSEQECLEEKCEFRRMINRDDLVKESTEGAFFHDHIYDIEEDANKDKSDSGMHFSFSGKGESGCENTETYFMSSVLQYDNFDSVSNDKGDYSKKKTESDAFCTVASE